MRRRRLGDSTLFPKPTERSKTVLRKMHSKYLRRMDELQQDAAELCQAAEREPNPGAKRRMMSLCEDMAAGMSDQATPGMIQYRARRIYDIRY